MKAAVREWSSSSQPTILKFSLVNYFLFVQYLSFFMLTFKRKLDLQTIDWLSANIGFTSLQAEQPQPTFGSSLLVAVFGGS